MTTTTRGALALVALALAACVGLDGGPSSPSTPIRFVLSFDDGPAPSTARVLDTLAANPVQPGIKAIFFVQTRAPEAGGGEVGRALMRREYDTGHLLAVHTGTPEGHVSHVTLTSAELEASLSQARADIAAIAGAAPRFVRPPFWHYDDDTLLSYARVGLAMLLTDINARDGELWGINLVPARSTLIRFQLENVKRELQAGALPVLRGAAPIVVTFHDVNDSTAENLSEYLSLLVNESRELGLVVAARPFYDRRADLERAAGMRVQRP